MKIPTTITALLSTGLAFALALLAHAAAAEHFVPLFPAAADPVRQGFVRVINHSGRSGEVQIRAMDDEGIRFGPTTLSIDANQTVHFNSTDLEYGNAAKGMPRGIGSGAGDWWLTASSGLDIEVLSYVRTPADGFLTSMHDLVRVDENDRYRVAVFNPADNLNQQSRLRMINAGEQVANLTITGIDGQGESPGSSVRLSIPSGAVETLDAKELESGSPKFQGALGDGASKWQLVVESDQPIFVMSLLLSPTSHLTNLSTAPANADEGAHTVSMFPAASDPLERQGFVRVINHAAESGEVFINAFDDTNRDYPRLTLSLDSDETVHINSDDLEMGNAAKGLVGGTGAGEGDWRLEFSSGLDIEVLAYIRTKRDGFLTSMHDRVPREGKRHRVPVFNPAANVNQASRLRLVNAGENTAEVVIAGIDDRGARSTGRVSVSVPAGTSRTLTALELEAGGDGFEGELGAGAGKWQLVVESEQPIIVMSLLASPTGHLTNLSTAPAVDFAPTDAAVFDDRFVGGRVVKDVPTNYVDFLAGGRFRKTEGAEIDSGDHTYTRVEPNKATIVLDYDDGGRCTYEFRFRSRTAGDLSYDCADDSGESGWHLAETPSADDSGDAHCRPNDIIDPGESCDLYGTGFTFDVESSGRSCLRAGGFISCSGNRQNLSNLTINGVRITLVAARNQDNSWTIENVDPIPPDSAVSGPDLVVSSASASDSRPAPGASFKLTAVVRNRGTDTSAATTLRYYRSNDARISRTDTEVGAQAVAELAAAARLDRSTTVTVPDAGTFYYGACVDAVAAESDTGNNCSSGVRVSVAGGRTTGGDFDLAGDNRAPDCIAHANGRFYVCDSYDDKVYAYATNGQRDAAADLDLAGDNGFPVGIAHANGRFHVVDTIDGKVYAYATNGQRDAAADFDLAGDNDSPAGIAHANGRFYVVNAFPHKVYAYWANGQRDAAADFDLAGDNGFPVGIAHANGRFYVVDNSDDKVYAYATNGERDAAADFDLDGDNSQPRGIAHANGLFYVVDWSDEKVYKVYAYDLAHPRPAGSDLVVASPSVSDATPDVGAVFQLRATVSNRGKSRSAATTLRYYRSDDDTISVADSEVGSEAVDPLDAAGTREFSIEVTAPSSSGTHYYGACVDAVFGESASRSNCSSGVRVSVAGGVTTGGDFDLARDNGAPQGIAHANGRFYVPDHTAYKVYAYATNGQRDAAADFDLARDNDHPSGIAHANGRFYVVNTFDSKVYAYATNGERDAAADFDLAGGGSGIAHANGRFYVADRTDDKVYAYWANGQRDAAADFDLDGDNDSPSGIAHANGRFYVVDWFDSNVYAYATNGERDAAADFDLDGDNDSPSGIAHANGRFYVVDWSDDKVYAYNPNPAGPDLVVASPSVSDATPDVGAVFRLRATVSNRGKSRSAATTLRYYRSDDDTISVADSAVGSEAVDALDAAGAREFSIEVTAPSSSGTHYYGACVDSVRGETDVANNCSTAVMVTVGGGGSGAPDLVVESPSVSDAEPDAGASFALSVVVRNQGDGRSSSTMLRYYRSNDAGISRTDTEVSAQAVAELAAAARLDRSTTVTAADAGTFYYGACVDAVRGETDVANNCSTAVMVTVGGGVSAAPDLVVESPSVSDAEPDAGASFALSVVVRNQGDGRSSSTMLRYYRSNDAGISRTDTEVGAQAVAELAAAARLDRSTTVTAADAGTFYYGACVDAVRGETDVANNCSTAVMVTVGGGGSGAPDLVVESPSVSDAEPDAGASFALSVVVRNQGDGRSSSTMLRYYRSNDAGISRTDTEVGAQAVAELAAAARLDRSTTVTAADAGTFYYGACVDAVRGETDVANNCSTAVMVTVGGGVSAAPDLVVESPSVSDAEPDAGASFALSVVVRNQGDGRSSSTMLRYYRSNDAGISRTDTEVGAQAVAELAAAARLDRSTTVTAADAGTFYYGACVDAVAAESDTGNNCSSGVRVSVAEGGTTGGGDFYLAGDNGSPAGIAHANGRFYVVDRGDDKVYAYRTNGQRDDGADFDLAGDNSSPHGIAHANGRFYVVDNSDDKVYAYATNGQRDAAADFDLDGHNSYPYMAHANGRFYISDYSDDKVYAYATNGQRDAAADFDLAGDNGSPTGIAHANGLFYVVDWGDDKVYAYATNGQRDAAADFDLAGDNGSPAGIAHANGWFYVVDDSDDKGYAYNPNPAGPDLVVASPSVSDATPDIGAVFQLRATVSNRGKSRSAATTLRYYRSDDSTISVADSEVGSEAVGALDAAGAREFSIEVTAPSVVGTYYYGACTDSVAGEPTGQNNCSPGVRVRVGEGFNLAGDNSDALGIAYANGRFYVVDRTDDKVYAYATNGQRDAAADFDLDGDNGHANGITHANRRFYVVDRTDDKVYAYATNGQRDAAADFDLAGDNGYATGIAYATGRFYVVDSTDSKVYAYATNGQRDAAADFDLAGDNGYATGIAYATGRFYVVDSTDGKVYAYWANGQRDAAADFDLEGDNRYPTGIAHANVMLYVIDSSDEGVYAYSPPPDSDGPDLVVQSPSTSEGAPEAGESFTFSATVRNRGNRQSPAATLRYFRSTDAAISPDDTELGSDSLGGLSASASRNRSVSLTAPDQEGCYFCGACVDTVEGESSTANNCSRAVEILVGERPDLAVTRAVLHYPYYGRIGESISMTVDVTNEGASISRPAKLRFSNGTEVEIPSLAPNETTTVEGHTVGSVQLGTSTYTACIADVPCEQETTNNCESKSVTYASPSRSPMTRAR